MRLLVTRPEADSGPLASLLAGMGHEVLEMPLMSICFLENVSLSARNWQAFLVTSANGARALGRRADIAALRPVPVLAVGPASAEATRAEGFTDVRAAGGDVHSLAALARSALDPAGGPLLHAAGSIVAGDLKGMLGADGFEVERSVLYEAVQIDTLPSLAADALRGGQIGGILLYSPRTARIFTELVEKAGLADQFAGVTAFCLSHAVAAEVQRLPGLTVKIADEPSQPSLLALLP